MEERHQTSLPKRIAAINQFVTATLESTLKSHLSESNPSLEEDKRPIIFILSNKKSNQSKDNKFSLGFFHVILTEPMKWLPRPSLAGRRLQRNLQYLGTIMCARWQHWEGYTHLGLIAKKNLLLQEV